MFGTTLVPVEIEISVSKGADILVGSTGSLAMRLGMIFASGALASGVRDISRITDVVAFVETDVRGTNDFFIAHLYGWS